MVKSNLTVNERNIWLQSNKENQVFPLFTGYLNDTGERKQNGTRWKQEKKQNSEKPL